MTYTEFYDITKLGHRLVDFEKAMLNYRAVIEGREMIAKGMKKEYPNMKIEAIRSRMAEQESRFALAAQAEYDDARCCAASFGITLKPIDVSQEVKGIMRKEYVSLNDIDV